MKNAPPDVTGRARQQAFLRKLAEILKRLRRERAAQATRERAAQRPAGVQE